VASFPEPLRSAVMDKRTPGLKFRLPVAEIDAGLKKGKVVFLWQQLKGFTDPPLDLQLASEHHQVEVQLPLQLIAPLFLSKFKPARPQSKVLVSDAIPDLFGPKQGSGPAAAPATPAAAPAEPLPAAAQVQPAAAPTPPPAPQKPHPLGELFGQPAKREWRVEEVVEPVAGLRGVAGALLASKDGLLIKGKLGAGQNGETLAAFLPQAYGRVKQYASDMRLGQLKGLAVETDSGLMDIRQIGEFFFGVLAAPGQPLPAAALKIIADHFGAAGQT